MEYFYVPPEAIDGAHAVVENEEFDHLTRVMRRKEGDELRISDGAGVAYDARIDSIAAGKARCRITGKYPLLNEPRTRLTLAVALLKNPSRYDTVVEKGTEIGVSAFVPLLTERTIPRHERTGRWTKIALSAMKQSGRCVLPRIHPPRTFADFVASARGTSLRFLAHEGADAAPLTIAASPEGREIVGCVGPEGGFSAEEVAFAAAAGFQIVSLGSRRLRTETAAILFGGLLLLET